MNNAWGFNLQDKNYKSTKILIQYLVKAAGYNSNFLLNVGPMPNGKIQPEFANTLKEIGMWTDKYGETIYGTRGGPVSPRTWGVTTQKANKVYVHILNAEDNNLLIGFLEKSEEHHLVQYRGQTEIRQDDLESHMVPAEILDETDTIL
jgi:alpha-L-fucosidase